MAVEAAPSRELWFWGEEVVEEGLVDLVRGGSLGEIREARGFARSDEPFYRPYVIGYGLC